MRMISLACSYQVKTSSLRDVWTTEGKLQLPCPLYLNSHSWAFCWMVYLETHGISPAFMKWIDAAGVPCVVFLTSLSSAKILARARSTLSCHAITCVCCVVTWHNVGHGELAQWASGSSLKPHLCRFASDKSEQWRNAEGLQLPKLSQLRSLGCQSHCFCPPAFFLQMSYLRLDHLTELHSDNIHWAHRVQHHFLNNCFLN